MLQHKREWSLKAPHNSVKLAHKSRKREMASFNLTAFDRKFPQLNLAQSTFTIPLSILPMVVTYYVQLQIIAQSFGTLHPDQNGFLQLCAEAHCQPVCPCARPVIGWPGVCDEGSASPEDVCCPSCKTQRENLAVAHR